MENKTIAKLQEPNIKNVLIGLGVILLVLAIFFYSKSKQNKTETPVPTAEEIIVQEDGAVKKTGEIIQPLSDEEIKALREEVDSVLSTAGESIVLQDSTGGMITGEAKRAFSDNKFYFKMIASHLNAVDKGYYYEGWLQKNGENMSIGRMEVNGYGEGMLYYTASVDRLDYNQAALTLEPEDGNPDPATYILIGEF